MTCRYVLRQTLIYGRAHFVYVTPSLVVHDMYLRLLLTSYKLVIVYLYMFRLYIFIMFEMVIMSAVFKKKIGIKLPNGFRVLQLWYQSTGLATLCLGGISVPKSGLEKS